MVLAKGPSIAQDMPVNQKQIFGPTVTETLGSCWLFTYRHLFCIATCRHVIDNKLHPGEQFKVVLRYNKANGGTDGTIFLLNSHWLRFHPGDTVKQTYDVAVFVLPKASVANFPIQVWSLDHQGNYPILDKSTKIKLVGYPASTITAAQINDPKLPLVATEFHASIASVSRYEGAKPPNYTKHIIGSLITEIEGSSSGHDGASGGLAFIESSRSSLAFGTISTVGRGTLVDKVTGALRQITFVGVTPMQQIIEAIS